MYIIYYTIYLSRFGDHTLRLNTLILLQQNIEICLVSMINKNVNILMPVAVIFPSNEYTKKKKKKTLWF